VLSSGNDLVQVVRRSKAAGSVVPAAIVFGRDQLAIDAACERAEALAIVGYTQTEVEPDLGNV